MRDIFLAGRPINAEPETVNRSKKRSWIIMAVSAALSAAAALTAGCAANQTDTLRNLYLGMPRSEVQEVLGMRDGEGSGLDFWCYDDIGTIYFGRSFADYADPELNDAAIMMHVEDQNWSIDRLVSDAVKSHNESKIPAEEYLAESHVILALDAHRERFTAYGIALYETFLPDGESDVKLIRGSHIPVALTFTRNNSGDYELTEYWEARDGDDYWPSIKQKFPEVAWNKVDTQLYIKQQQQDCSDEAKRFFLGAIPLKYVQ
jgi:hypothetical protein